MRYRLAAIFYDCLLLLSVFFFSTLVILPFTGGQAIAPGNLPYILYLYSLSYLYFTWQWHLAGQTLGMRAWRIRLVSYTGEQIDYRTASLRFILATLSVLPAGTGFLWSIPDRDNLAFHDRWTGTLPVTPETTSDQAS